MQKNYSTPKLLFNNIFHIKVLNEIKSKNNTKIILCDHLLI